ncbi:hypothetical protein NM208_g7153 [Fusarium decemcellulare]|uniref:Uncharacterized protein n=1 Tax=Fusarium decemcellulare TaxID=57161 RepID=A0ACC1SAI0_9HYPO|nr:hypothetical protein NM208_g7153 [Fusarium decemcellulare]
MSRRPVPSEAENDTSNQPKRAKLGTSPYEGPGYRLQFKDECVIMVPRGIVEKYAPLAAKVNDGVISFKKMGKREAHTFVHFLFTGAFELLDQSGQDADEKLDQACGACLWVYNAAVRLGLDDLARLSMDKICELGDHLIVSWIVRVMDKEKFWLFEPRRSLADYIAQKATMVDFDVGQDHVDGLRMDIGEARTTSSILLESMLQMKIMLQKYEKLFGRFS